MGDVLTQFLSDLRARLLTERGLFLVATVVVAIAFFWFFEDLVLYSIFNRSLSSADDAYFAMISRTLVTNGIYGLPLSDLQVSEFEPSIGTGPALLLPGALVIALFGPHYTAPGLTAHILFLLQMAGVFAVLAPRYGLGRVLAFVTACVATMHVMSGMRWYFPTFIGEVPAFGYFLLGTVVLATANSKWRLAAAGALLCLALLTKVITLFLIAGVGIAWSVQAIRARGPVQWLISGVVIAAGAAVPVLLLEVYKFISLGPAEYMGHFGRQIDAMIQYGAAEEAENVNRLQRALEIATTAYLLSWRTALAALVAMAAAFAPFVGRDKPSGEIGLAGLLWSGVVVFLIYYLTTGTMWDRYLAMAVFASAAAIAAPLLSLQTRWGAGFAALLIVLLFVGADFGRGFSTAQAMRPEQEAVVAAIEGEPGLPLVIRSWHSGFGTVFLAEGREWDESARVERFRNRAFIFVAQRHFTPADDPFVEDVLRRCPDLGPPLPSYHLRRCGINYWNAPS